MSVYKNIQPIRLDKIKTCELASRPSKVAIKDFAAPKEADDSLKNFLDKLPNILAVQSLRELAKQIRCFVMSNNLIFFKCRVSHYVIVR